jgi:P27 family predicted phage terminase small subunit
MQRGNPGKRQSKRSLADQTKPGTPKPPARVKGEALAEWKRIVPELAASGRLAMVDRALLTLFCRTWARWCELDTLLTQPVVKGYRNADRKHPAWPMYRELGRDLAAYAKELGLSWNGRARATVDDDDEEASSPFD